MATRKISKVVPTFDQMITGSAALTLINPPRTKPTRINTVFELLCVIPPAAKPQKAARNGFVVHLAISNLNLWLARFFNELLNILIPLKNSPIPATMVAIVSNVFILTDCYFSAMYS